MKIGIYSGSFNPIHHGHLMIANYMAEFAGLDEVWFVLSPHNPLKNKDILASERHRTQMLELALSGFSRLKVCDIELRLPRPSYTIDTLTALQKTISATFVFAHHRVRQLGGVWAMEGLRISDSAT